VSGRPWPCAIFYTDVDGTMIDSSYRLDPEAPGAALALAEAGVVLVLATSKTLAEAMMYVDRLGLSRSGGYAVIAEEGAVIHAPPEILPEERIVTGRMEPEEALSLLPGECRARVKPIQWMSPEEVARLTGLPPGEAEAATMREATAALHGPRRCLEAGLVEALRRGLYARLGRVFLMLGRHPGKAGAAVLLEERSPRLRGVPERYAAGDDPMDEGLLSLADRAFIVARSGLRPSFTPHLASYTIVPPAPRGWVIAAKEAATAAAHRCGLRGPQ